MEKKKPHYLLADVKTLAADGKIAATQTALAGAAALNFHFCDMVELVETLEPADFYKSMTTHVDHTIWQIASPLRKAMSI